MSVLSFTGLNANFECWYEAVKEFTPQSWYFKLTEDQKRVLIAKTFDKMCENIPYFQEMHDRPDTTGIQGDHVMHELQIQIDNQIKGGEAFFRTNLFSPKDAGICRVRSGEETLKLVTSSYRMYRGYHRALLNDDLYFVFREWVEMEEEFRCFIQNGKVKAISQYVDSDSINKGTGAKESDLYAFAKEDYLSLYRYLQNVIEKTEIQDAVIDVACTEEGFVVIELNPYSKYTDKSLFAKEDIYQAEMEFAEIRYWISPDMFQILWVSEQGLIIDEGTRQVDPEPEQDFSRLLEGRVKKRISILTD